MNYLNFLDFLALVSKVYAMKNVTVRDVHGNEIAFYKNLSNNRKLIEVELGERFGAGKYKLCFRNPAKKTKDKDGKTKKGKAYPTTEVVFVGNAPGAKVAVMPQHQTGTQYAGYGGGAQSVIMLEKFGELLNAMNGFNTQLKSLETKMAERDKEDEEEEEEEEEESITKKLGVVIGNPKYANIFVGLLTGNPPVILATLKNAIDKEPEALTALIGECTEIILS